MYWNNQASFISLISKTNFLLVVSMTLLKECVKLFVPDLDLSIDFLVFLCDFL